MKKDAVTKLLDEIEKILDRTGQTCADISRDIHRDYHRVYAWVKVRKFKPSGEGVLLLQQWRDKNLATVK